MFSLEGRIAIVTGGASGTGRGISEVLSRAGAHVAIADIDVERGKATAGDIGGTFVPLDVTSQEQCRSVVDGLVAQFGHLDVLCSTTETYPQVSRGDMTDEQWDKMQDVNLQSTSFIIQAALQPMRQRGYGRIVITSRLTESMTGFPPRSHYGASKAGQQRFMRDAAIEYVRDGVTINAVLSGKVLTPRDVGHAACFLASEEARLITGQTLVVDDSQPNVKPVPGSWSEDTGEVPEKQLFRWKDDGGALHPDA